MATWYWVGGTGTWNSSTTTNWASTSGGAGGAGVPTSSDTAIIDTNSGTGTITCTSASATCLNLTVTATQAITLTGTLSLIYGNLTYPSSGSFASTVALTFVGTTTGNTITTNSITLNNTMTFNGVGGAWTLGSNLLLGNFAFTVTNGSFNANNFNVTAGTFTFASTAGLITVGTGTWTALGTGTVWSPGTAAGSFSDGSSNNWTITNNSGVTYSPSGPTTVSNSNSAVFNGSSSYLSTPNQTAFQFGTGNFTYESWLNPASLSGNNRAISLGAYSTSGNFQIECNPTNITVHINGSFSSYTYTWTLNTWVYIAVVRNSGTITVYVNGVSIGTGSQAGTINSTSPLTIGSNSTAGGNIFNGLIYNTRLSNTALYTTNFTPPTTPLTSSGSTVLLLAITQTGGITKNANINIADTSTTGKTFAGNSYTYGVLGITGSTGVATYTITGVNTFANITSSKTVASTLIFSASTITTLGNFSISLSLIHI